MRRRRIRRPKKKNEKGEANEDDKEKPAGPKPWLDRDDAINKAQNAWRKVCTDLVKDFTAEVGEANGYLQAVDRLAGQCI